MIQAHYLRRNETTRLPRAFVYLDCEAWQRRTGPTETQTFRMAAVAFDFTRTDSPSRSRHERATFTDLAELWDWITARVTARHRVVLVCHNLGYDLRVSDAFTHLPARGWRWHAGRLSRGQAWAIWRKGSRNLTMVDSLSWLPTALDGLGTMVGVSKPPLPSPTAPVGTWRERCEADVAILRECWGRVMGWLEAEDLGNFKVTGAGQAWTAFRHRFYDRPIVVHGKQEAREQEREAAWTGRCEAWRHGTLTGGPWHEWDLTAAYAQVAATCDLPWRYKCPAGPLTPTRRFSLAQRQSVLQRVTVTTDVPVVPARTSHGIAWPVGTFETILWENEVRLAVQAGARVRTTESWLYSHGPVLQSWGRWVLAELAKGPTELDPVIRLVLKHWSRALVGRFGARFTTWEDFGQAPDFDVVLSRYGHADDAEPSELLQLGHDLYLGQPAGYGENACPMILSWIMAETRCRLWHAMTTAGLDHVAYVDTDGLVVDDAGHANLRAARIPTLRVKRTFRSMTVHGPRQVVLGGRLKAAGIASSAVRNDDGSYTADVFTSLPTSLRRGQHDRVMVTERTVTMRGTDHRRVHLEDGRTGPVELC